MVEAKLEVRAKAAEPMAGILQLLEGPTAVRGSYSADRGAGESAAGGTGTAQEKVKEGVELPRLTLMPALPVPSFDSPGHGAEIKWDPRGAASGRRGFKLIAIREGRD